MSYRASADASPVPPPSIPRFGRAARGGRARLRAFLAIFVLAAAAPGAGAEMPRGLALHVDRPGVYAVDLSEVALRAGLEGTLPLPGLRLAHQGRPLATWIDGAGADGRLVFLADRATFRRTDPRHALPFEVLQLTWAEPADAGSVPPPPWRAAPAATTTGAPEPKADPASLPPASPRRVRHVEEDIVRAAATTFDEDRVETLWYWTSLTQLSSSRLEVDLGALADRVQGGSPEEPSGIDVTVRLLGWSKTGTPEGVAQHRVEAFLNDRPVGALDFAGRRTASLELADLPAELLGDRENLLRIEVPKRTLPGETDPMVDIVYLDWIEVSYRAASPLADPGAPLLLDASQTTRWLADPAGSPGSRLLTAAGWTAPRRGEGDRAGWLLPPGEGTEAWVVDEADLRAPRAVRRLATWPGEIPADTEYLMIAPRGLAAGTDRLAAFHRRLGRRVAVVDPEAIYDRFGGGRPGAHAIRRFVDHQLGRSEALRWLLLVGDADWFEPDDAPPGPDREPAGRNRIPTWTYLSRFGPAASDHFFVLDSADETRPRLAVGRLPVTEPAALDAYVDKAMRWVESAGTGRADAPPSVLMLSDASKGSLLQQRRMRERLADLPVALVGLGGGSGGEAGNQGAQRDEGGLAPVDPDEAVVEAFVREPWLVYFGGHGSRTMWLLGDPLDPDPTRFFDLEDLARLEPTAAPPIALSISCATAPFDHPSADSLGEAMVTRPDRGAIAFLGASAALHTPPAFGEALVRNLLAMETVGEAVAAAKASAGRAPVSYLYSLLGDPALPLGPLAAERPEGAGEEHQGEQ